MTGGNPKEMKVVDVRMPPLGESVSEARISRWLKAVGDRVAHEEPLLEVETDKVETELPSPAEGYLIAINAPEGSVVDIGSLIATLSPEASPTSHEPRLAAPPAAETSRAAQLAAGVRSPAVRKLLADAKLDPATVTATGADGRITRADVLRHMAADVQPPSSDAPAEAARSVPPSPPERHQPLSPSAIPTSRPRLDSERVPFTAVRRRTAERMAAAHATIPQVTTSMRVDYTAVAELRREAGPRAKARDGYSLTYLPFVARAVVEGLRAYPLLNASVDGDGLLVHRGIDLGIAVDLDLKGLVVPVVRSAEDLRLPALAGRIADVAARARQRKLSVDDLTGSTFTVTNPGGFGTLVTTPIVNPPEVAILSVEGIGKELAVRTVDGDDVIAVRTLGHLALSYDHRAVDGAYAAAFLAVVRDTIETRDWQLEL